VKAVAKRLSIHWGRKISERSSPPEPSQSLLSSDEDRWRRATWIHFESRLLTHLRQRGARSVDELVEDPPEVLWLALTREEVEAVVEFARRRGLVYPLGHEKRADGEHTRDEWILTEKGESATQLGFRWLRSKAGGVVKIVSLLLALLGALGVTSAFGQWMRTNQSTDIIWLSGLLVAYIAIFGLAGLFTLRARTSGASRRAAAAADWVRWRHERPDWHALATRPFPWARTILAGVVTVGVPAALVSFGVLSDRSLQVVAAIIFPVAFKPAMSWMKRWQTLEAKARELEKAKTEAG